MNQPVSKAAKLLKGEISNEGGYLKKLAKSSKQYTQDLYKTSKSFGKNVADQVNDHGHMARFLPYGIGPSVTKTMKSNATFTRQQYALWKGIAKKAVGKKDIEDVVHEGRGDRRFNDEAWDKNLAYNTVKQSYLIYAEYLQNLIDGMDFLNDKAEQRAKFVMRQMINGLAPTNYLTTNPEALREFWETKGESLLKGMENVWHDLSQHATYGAFNISMTDDDAFKLGVNIATTPGKVIFQNELIQLIQYEPMTEKVHKTPILITPAFINKYYILDLSKKNSFVRWLVEQGFTVFIISWVNPDRSLADMGYEEYVLNGPVAALDAIERATGEKEVNAIGYCVGGTLLATTQAYLSAIDDKRIKSTTYLACLQDFTKPGEMGVYITDESLRLIDIDCAINGFFDGRRIAFLFTLLRENNLLWPYWVQNYLMGKQPAPFDLLYWNCDATNMPRKLCREYLRNMYMNNRLIEQNGIDVDGVGIDIRNIKTPAYFVSTKSDHIAVWEGTYPGALTHSGDVRFVLGGSGHIAGIINHPDANKYGYHTNDELPNTPRKWLQGATEHEGSWWLDWVEWAKPKSGAMVAARIPGEGRLPVIEDAPGRYAKRQVHDIARGV